MRLPDASVCDMASSIVLTASSASFGASWLWRALNSSMSCDLVMARFSPLWTRWLLFLVLRAQLGLQQRAQVRGAGAAARLGGVLLHRRGFLGRVLLLDRQVDRAALAVDVDDHRLDLLAFGQVLAHVLDAVARDLGGAQVSLHVRGELDHGALRLDRLDDALHHRALVVRGDEVAERVAGELLDAERDALALDVDRQHHGLGLVALLQRLDRLLARRLPGEVGEVHQAVDVARQADEHAEIGDRLDHALHLVALLVVHGELFPRVRHALLHAERDAAAVLVDLEDHHLDLVAERHHLRGMHVLVGPVHLGDVHQALDAALDLDERAVVGDVGDLAEEARALRVAAGDADPRVLAQLLEAQRDAVLLGVELEDLGGHLVAHRQDFRRVLHAAPCEVGDVQQAVDAAQVHERAVVGDVLHHALHDRAFLQRLEQLLALDAGGFLHDGTAGNHHVVPLAVELDDLELELLAFQVRGVLHRAQVDERAGQEGADAVHHDGEAALHLAGDDTLDDRAGGERVVEAGPRGELLGLVARELGGAEAVFEGLDRDRDEVAGLHLDLSAVVLEFFGGDGAFGLQARVDDHDVGVDRDDLGGDHFAHAHLLAGEAFLEEGGEAVFGGGVGVGGGLGQHWTSVTFGWTAMAVVDIRQAGPFELTP